jgi:hypothetical protein
MKKSRFSELLQQFRVGICAANPCAVSMSRVASLDELTQLEKWIPELYASPNI